MKKLEKTVVKKVEYLIENTGAKKVFIAKKIGVSRSTLSHLINDNNERYAVASEETIKRIINKLNETWPMLQGIGE